MEPGLGAAIAAALAERGMTRAQLAEAARVDDRQLARVIGGKSGLSLDSFRRVSGGLGLHPADLLLAAWPPSPPAPGRAAA